jgi:FkbM family methyltransferase
MKLIDALKGKRHAAKTLFRMWEYLENWQSVWSAYRSGAPIPALVFRRGFTLHHNKWDCPVSLLDEIFAEQLYSRRLKTKLSGVVVDIGANIGAVVLDMTTRFPEVEIHAYEPNPATCETLNRNVRENGIADRVKVFGEAVTGHSGTFNLWVNLVSVGCTGYAADAPAPGAELTPVSSVDLNMVVDRAVGRQISLLKIDAEGAEADIVENARPGCLDSVQQVAIEYHDSLCPDASGRCEAVLVQQGFKYTRVVDQSHPGIGMLYGWRAN